MAERHPPDMELVVAPNDATCFICQRHIGPFMLQIDRAPEIGGGRRYMCQFCGRDLWDKFKDEEENDA